ncbi:MAG: hypothetical protein Q9197_001413 [Variospora fuerteventurae]
MTTRSQLSVVEPQEPLSVIGQRIRSSFGALEFQISQCQGQDALAITLQDVSQRYDLWAVNLGLFTAGHSSLDYRLGDAPLIYDYTRSALADLEKYLKNAVQALQETHEDKFISSVVIGQATNSNSPDAAQTVISDDSEEEDLETYDDDSVATTALENASGIIDGLYRLSFKIRNPTTRTGFSKAQSYQEIDDETGVNLIKVLADFDRQHVEQVFIQLREGRTAASPAASEYESSDHKERDEDEEYEDDEDDKDNEDDGDDDDGEKNEEDEDNEDDRDDEDDDDGEINEDDEEEDEEDEENEEGDSAFEMSGSKLQKHYLVKRLAKANTRRRQQFKHWQKHRNKVDANSQQVKDFAPWLSNLRVPNTSHKEMLKVAPIPNQPAPSIPSTVTRVDPAKIDLDDTRSLVSTSTYARVSRTRKEHPRSSSDNLEDSRAHLASQHSDDSVSTHLEMIGLDSTQGNQRRTCPICLEDHVTDEHVGIHLQQIALFALPRSTGLEGDSHVDDDASAAAVDDLERDREDGSDTRSFSDEGERPPEAVYGIDYQYVGNMLADLDPYEMAPDKRQIEDDWSVVYNPKLPRELDIELIQSIHFSGLFMSVKFSYNGDFLAIGQDRFAVVYETKAWAKVFTLQHDVVDSGQNSGGNVWIWDASFDPHGKYVATSANDGLIRVFLMSNGTLAYTLAGHTDGVTSINFLPDSSGLFSGSWDLTVRLWNIEAASEELNLKTTDPVYCAAVSADSQLLAAGLPDCSAMIWNRQGTLVATLSGVEGHFGVISSIAFAPQNHEVVTASRDRTLKVWDLRDITKPLVPRRTFTGHKLAQGSVYSATFTRDARWIMSSSVDRGNGVQFWDPNTGDAALRIDGHTDEDTENINRRVRQLEDEDFGLMQSPSDREMLQQTEGKDKGTTRGSVKSLVTK